MGPPYTLPFGFVMEPSEIYHGFRVGNILCVWRTLSHATSPNGYCLCLARITPYMNGLVENITLLLEFSSLAINVKRKKKKKLRWNLSDFINTRAVSLTLVCVCFYVRHLETSLSDLNICILLLFLWLSYTPCYFH